MLIAKGSGLTKMNLHCRSQRQSFMGKKVCSVYGGIITVLFILSF